MPITRTAPRKARRTDAPAGSGEVERYEQLRALALDGEPSGFRLGLALLERRGVTAWARAWDSTAPTRAAAPTAPAPAPVDVELVGALASMALAHAAAG
jgi:hypothetical protein